MAGAVDLNYNLFASDGAGVHGLQQLAGGNDGASPRGSLTAQAPVKMHRLPCHRRWTEALVLAELVKEPMPR